MKQLFILHLAGAIVIQDRLNAEKARCRKEISMSGKKRTILLVENESSRATSEEQALQKLGYEVIVVNTAEKAIEAAKAIPGIDLILMDMDLGQGIDGTDAARTILEGNDLPLVFISSGAEKDVVEKIETITAYGFVVKGSGSTVLEASLKTAFKLFESNRYVREAKNHLKSIMESTNDLIWSVSPGDYALVAFNHALSDYFLTERNILIRPGMKPSDLFPTGEFAGIWEGFYGKATQNGSFTTEYGANSGSSTLELTINSIMVNGRLCGLAVFGKDITELRRREAELRESEMKYRSLIECSSDAIFCVDEKGEYKFTNQLFAGTFGKTPDYFIGKTFWDIYPKEHADYRYETTKRVLATGISESIEVQVPLPGKTLYFYATANPIKDENGKIILVLTHATNITDRKHAEMEVQRQLSEKSILLKEVHHRIKNNIASIEALLSMQSDSSSNPETVSTLQDAIGRVGSMRVLYDKLLIGEDYQNASVKNYIESVFEAVMALFPGNTRITSVQRIDDFNLDPRNLFTLGLIVNELLTNILKYAFKGRDSGVITITIGIVEGHVTLVIQDDGRGLSPDFDLANSKGFGLMLVRMLSESLHGVFTIKNGDGTKSTLEFDV